METLAEDGKGIGRRKHKRFWIERELALNRELIESTCPTTKDRMLNFITAEFLSD
jgi:hypothetical protein